MEWCIKLQADHKERRQKVAVVDFYPKYNGLMVLDKRFTLNLRAKVRKVLYCLYLGCRV